MPQRGVFITLDGCDGTGKSTNLTFIKAYLEEKGIPLVVTCEPGGTSLGKAIRELVLAERETPLLATTVALLMFAARNQHLHEVILPALDQGKCVICDRFTDATYAYQGRGNSAVTDAISKLQCLVQGNLRPDLTLLLDADYEVCMQRICARKKQDSFDLQGRAFFDCVRNTYLSLAQENPKQYKVINASLPLEQVQDSIARAFESQHCKLLAE